MMESDESGTREELDLPDGVKLEVRSSHRHHIDQTVTLSARDPDGHGGVTSMPIEISVSASVSTYKNEPAPPRMNFSSHLMMMSRKQWELTKRLGDQAWDEYEKRFPTEGGSK